MLYLIAYDVPEDARRTKLALVLKDFGVRVQFSVFEARMDEETRIRMLARIAETIEVADDHVRVYRLCGGCEEAITILGSGEVTEDPDVYVV